MFQALICSSSGGTVYTVVGIFCAYYVSWLLAGLEWNPARTSGVPRNFFSEGRFQQIQLRTEDIENGDLGVAAPLGQGFH
jgi:hypothetical protein